MLQQTSKKSLSALQVLHISKKIYSFSKYFFGNTHSIANFECVFPVPHACLPIFFAENKSENKLNWKALLWKWTQQGFTKNFYFCSCLWVKINFKFWSNYVLSIESKACTACLAFMDATPLTGRHNGSSLKRLPNLLSLPTQIERHGLIPQKGSRWIGRWRTTWSTVCSSAPHSQGAEGAIPH